MAKSGQLVDKQVFSMHLAKSGSTKIGPCFYLQVAKALETILNPLQTVFGAKLHFSLPLLASHCCCPLCSISALLSLNDTCSSPAKPSQRSQQHNTWGQLHQFGACRKHSQRHTCCVLRIGEGCRVPGEVDRQGPHPQRVGTGAPPHAHCQAQSDQLQAAVRQPAVHADGAGLDPTLRLHLPPPLPVRPWLGDAGQVVQPGL